MALCGRVGRSWLRGGPRRASPKQDVFPLGTLPDVAYAERSVLSGGGYIMKALMTTAATSAVLFLSAGIASAATFDFATLALNPTTGVGEGSWDSRNSAVNVAGGSYDNDTDSYEVGGIVVTADGYAYSVDAGGEIGPHLAFAAEYDPTYAYLDGLSGEKEAGLGVCGSVTNSFQCSPSNDDNIGPDGGLNPQNQTGLYEFVTLTFNVAVQLSDVVFRDDNHNVITSGGIGLSIDDPTSGDMIFVITDIATWAGVNSAHGFYSNTWSFASISGEFCTVPVPLSSSNDNGYYGVSTCTNFYIDSVTASPIPLPAAGFLLLGGLGGLVAMKRRRKA